MHFSDLDTGYSILRLLVDPLRGESIPVGAVAWDANRDWHSVRLLSPSERLEGIDPERRLMLRMLERQLRRWVKSSTAPYSGVQASPGTAEFWDAVRRALSTGVILDPPKAMDSLSVPEEMDLLFDAIVKPIQNPNVVRTRMEGALKRALGPDLEKSTRPRLEVRAFHSTYEKVMRGARGEGGVVILEAVNLAGRNAKKDADSLVSRMLRIIEGEAGHLSTVIGYTASPGGLNGETHLREWMQEKVTPYVFDLSRQAEQFRSAADEMLSAVGAQTGIFQ